MGSGVATPFEPVLVAWVDVVDALVGSEVLVGMAVVCPVGIVASAQYL